jgi:putative glutamine amidotransferase
MKQPRIGISVLLRDSTRYQNYRQRVLEAGADPVEIAPDAGDSGLDGLDGLLLTGGGDVDPTRYGAERHPQTDGVHPELDALELRLVAAARERDLPILAICRGHQLLNVALGGQLLQHIEGDQHRAHSTEGYPSRWHTVRIEPGSRLASLLGTGELEVNSRHHQAVLPETLAPGLRGTAFSPDGLVEGMEGADGAWMTSVQWHPEREEVIDRCAALFEDFVRAAARREAAEV